MYHVFVSVCSIDVSRCVYVCVFRINAVYIIKIPIQQHNKSQFLNFCGENIFYANINLSPNDCFKTKKNYGLQLEWLLI